MIAPDIRENIFELVEFWGLERNLPFELHELEDHLLDYAETTSTLVLLDEFDRFNLLLTVAETFEFARWEELMERTTEYGDER